MLAVPSWVAASACLMDGISPVFNDQRHKVAARSSSERTYRPSKVNSECPEEAEEGGVGEEGGLPWEGEDDMVATTSMKYDEHPLAMPRLA